MRTRIKVADLSVAQWSWLNIHLPEDQEFAPEDVRMCVEFEIGPQLSPIHIELRPRVFVALMTRLQEVDRAERTAQAVLTPDVLPDRPSQSDGAEYAPGSRPLDPRPFRGTYR